MFAVLLILFLLTTSVGFAIGIFHVPDRTPDNRGIHGSAEEFGRIRVRPIIDVGSLSMPESVVRPAVALHDWAPASTATRFRPGLQ